MNGIGFFFSSIGIGVAPCTGGICYQYMSGWRLIAWSEEAFEDVDGGGLGYGYCLVRTEVRFLWQVLFGIYTSFVLRGPPDDGDSGPRSGDR